MTTLSPTAQTDHIKNGYLPKYIVLGARSVGLFQHECETIVAARAIGKTDDEIKEIVKALEKQREQSANELLERLAA